MWTCAKCGEEIQDQFRNCWKCAGGESAEAPPVPDGRPPGLKLGGRRYPWTWVLVVALLLFLLIDATVAARGNFSRMTTLDRIWACLLVVMILGIVSGQPFALRTTAALLVAGGILKVVLLFLVTASSELIGYRGLAKETIHVLLTFGAAVLLITHLARPRG